MKTAYEVLKPYAIVGWLVTDKGYSIEEVNSLSSLEIIMLEDDFNRFYAKKCSELRK